MTTTEARILDATCRQLREARQAAGLSLRELARRAGTSHATLLAYEEGRKVPAITTWLRVMHAAGYAVDFHRERRIREANGLPRGLELAAALALAEQFPSAPTPRLGLPRFPSAPTHGK
jgi:transcriptional regulator with XRE-family HTH domain